MGDKSVLIAIPVVVAALIGCAQAYERRQAYKTGVYMGNAAFRAETRQNRRHLTSDWVMENALASARIIPALAESQTLRTGFRDGWREARTAASDH